MKNTILEKWMKKRLNVEGKLTREMIDNYQLNQINDLLPYAKRGSFYRKKMKNIDNISSLDDIKKLPFTTESDVAKYGNEMICVSQTQISKIATLETSGTTGKQKRIYFTKSDLEQTIDFFHNGLSQFIKKKDTVLILMPSKIENSIGDLIEKGIGRIGGKGIKYGLLDDFKKASEILKNIDSIIGMPMQVLALGRYIKSKGYSVNIKGILLSADNAPKEIFEEIKDIFDADVYNHYGITEAGLGGAVECSKHDGMHPRELELYFEIIDLKTKEKLPDGEWGEIVITTLNREAMPLIRYRTGDYGRLIEGECMCEAPFKRLDFLKGRIKDEEEISIKELDIVMYKFSSLIDYKISLDHNSKKINVSYYFLNYNIPKKKELADSLSHYIENIDTIKNYKIEIKINSDEKHNRIHKGKRVIY